MSPLLRLCARIDHINAWIGKACGWLLLAAILVSSGNALARFAFNRSSNAWIELQGYLFGAAFLLACAYVLQRNEHIRIDLISARLSPHWRARLDTIGHALFTLPFCVVMIVTGVPFFWRALKDHETSTSVGGLLIWPAKLLVPLAFALLLAQILANLARSFASQDDA